MLPDCENRAMPDPSPGWIEDCIKFRHRILTGHYAHCCPCWDELPIDETTQEFSSCTCYGQWIIDCVPV
jgi:hypothetical protein